LYKVRLVLLSTQHWPNEQGWLWCDEVGLWLGVVEHQFPRATSLVKTPRFFHKEGQLVLTAKEAEACARRAAEAARLKALLARSK